MCDFASNGGILAISKWLVALAGILLVGFGLNKKQ